MSVSNLRPRSVTSSPPLQTGFVGALDQGAYMPARWTVRCPSRYGTAYSCVAGAVRLEVPFETE